LIRRSFALRTALGAALLMLLAALLAAGWVWRGAEAELRAQLDRALAAEAESLVREFEAFGLPGLAEQARSSARRQGPIFIWLQADGRPLAGRFGLAPPPPPLRGFASYADPVSGARLRALGVVLPGGANLVLGAELREIEHAAARLAWGPALAAVLAALLASTLGFVAARRVERRIAAAREAARAIMEGDLARRLPDAGTQGEFDRLAATLNAMLARIEALVEAQRQVTEDIAHDLRTPLSRLRQRLEAALAAARDAERDAQTLAEALCELDAVLATFRTLLRIARAASGEGRDAFQRVDLSALVAGVAEAYAAVAEEAGRDFAIDIAPGVTMRGDAALLRQALANLLDNALLHGGSRIRVALREGPVIEVSDDGPGIPPEERARVTRRFVRLEASRHTPGTGLGLALVEAAARLHGGILEIADGPGGRGVALRLILRAGL
jgi:signal transduction histidine kinase